ncbi:MAG: hypothetical protein KIT31_39990, partial [Deltaproteobacteria bacterium]|nr:hypothetical protein [Deltaproteobacteria bacterium]
MKHPPQEPDVVNRHAIAMSGIGVTVAIAVGVVVVFLLAGSSTRELAAGGATRRGLPTEVSNVELAPFEAEAQGLEGNQYATHFLDTFGWVDRERGIVHVPIDTAIRLYLTRRRETG